MLILFQEFHDNNDETFSEKLYSISLQSTFIFRPFISAMPFYNTYNVSNALAKNFGRSQISFWNRYQLGHQFANEKNKTKQNKRNKANKQNYKVTYLVV